MLLFLSFLSSQLSRLHMLLSSFEFDQLKRSLIPSWPCSWVLENVRFYQVPSSRFDLFPHFSLHFHYLRHWNSIDLINHSFWCSNLSFCPVFSWSLGIIDRHPAKVSLHTGRHSYTLCRPWHWYKDEVILQILVVMVLIYNQNLDLWGGALISSSYLVDFYH